MNYKQLCLIKDAVDTFNDAEFVSVLNESEVAVRNNKTNEIWKLNYVFGEDGKLSFNTENAVVVETAEEEEKVDAKQEIIKAFSHALINEDEVGLEYVKEVILEAEDLFAVGKQSVYSEDSVEVEGEEVWSFKEDLDISDEEKTIITNISNKWEEKLDQFEQSKKEFKSAGNLFSEDTIRSGEIDNPLDLLAQLAEKREAINAMFEQKEVLTQFNALVLEAAGTEEVALAALKDINPLSATDAEFETKVTKNLVLAKKEFNESTINVRELTKKISAIKKEVLNESLHQNDYGNESKFSYLRFNSGYFTRRDLNAIMSDFDSVIGECLNMNRDELNMIQEMKDTIDYMYRTNQISDEVVSGVLNRFNESFFAKGIPNGSADLMNPEKSRPDTAGLHLKNQHRAIAPESV